MIAGTARVCRHHHGWFAAFELFEADPVTVGPYATRELAEGSRDSMLEEVVEQTRAEGLTIEILTLGDARVIVVLGPSV